jgi:hypothetical protein
MLSHIVYEDRGGSILISEAFLLQLYQRQESKTLETDFLRFRGGIWLSLSLLGDLLLFSSFFGPPMVSNVETL